MSCPAEPTYPPLALVRLDRRRRIVGGLLGLAQLLGADPESIAGKCLDDLLSRRDRRGRGLYNDLVAQLGSGSHRGVLVTLCAAAEDPRLVLLDMHRQPDAWQVAIRPITPRDVVHDLVLSDERWRGILRGAAEGIAVIDPDNSLVEFNELFLTLLKVTDSGSVLLAGEAVRGRDVFSLIEDDSLQDVRKGVARLKRTTEFTIRRGEKTLSVTATPMVIAGRLRVGTCLVVRDLTADREVARLSTEAARSAGMAEIATGVLHNVGNALCSVRTSGTVIAERLRGGALPKLDRLCALLQEQDDLSAFIGSKKGAKIVPFLEAIRAALHAEREDIKLQVECLHDSVEHIANVVASQNRHARSATPEACLASELIKATLGLAQPTCDEMGVPLICDAADETTVVTAPHTVVQILTNLVRNAAQAVRDANVVSGNVRVEQALDGATWVVRVVDNGVGFDPATKEELFRYGFTTKRDGSGFGLHDCANACTALGGELIAQSPGPGQGATFELRLPRLVSDDEAAA